MTEKKRKELSDKAIFELQNELNNDVEGGHINGDKILCNLLKTLGFDEVVNAWDELSKWYA